MNKPKIALLIDWYLPGTKAGGPVRSAYSLLNLLKDDFDFYIITGNKDLGSSEPYTDVPSDTLFEKDGIHYYYISGMKLTSKTMLRLFREIDPALIYLNSFWSYHFSISLVKLKHNGAIKAPVLLAPRGMLGRGALGLKSLKKRFYLAIAKRLGWYKNIVFHATQALEEQDIKVEFPTAKIVTAPNINSSPLRDNTSQKTTGSLRLFFLSRVAEVKNLHFALDVLKDVPASCSVDYDIFGNLEDVAYWERCKQIISQLPKHIRVNYKRELAFNEVQETISTYHLLLMPTLNENYGHSIVESLLSGCPVIISDQTPWTDLKENNAGYSISLSDRQQFIAAIVDSAQMDQTAFTEKSKAAHRYIKEKINLNLASTHYKNLFNGCIKN